MLRLGVRRARYAFSCKGVGATAFMDIVKISMTGTMADILIATFLRRELKENSIVTKPPSPALLQEDIFLRENVLTSQWALDFSSLRKGRLDMVDTLMDSDRY